MASANKLAWTYTDDNGDDWRVAASKAITDQVNGSAAVKVGGSAAAATVKRLPPYIKPRKRYVVYGNVRRAVVCYDRTCDLWAVPGTTITLETSGADQTFTRTADGVYNERRRDTTSQSS